MAQRTLVIVTPDNLYQVLFREFRFKSWNCRISGDTADLVYQDGSTNPEVFLVFADHFEKLDLARVVSKIKGTFAKSLVACIVGLTEPVLVMLHGEPRIDMDSETPLRLSELDDLERVLDDVCGPAGSSPNVPTVTATQLQLLEAIAIGRSNREIAQARSVSVKAVEGLVGRAMSRIGVAEEAGVRAKVVAAQTYLAELQRN